MGGHPSRPAVAGRLQRSTRRHRAGSPRTPAQDDVAAVPLDLAPGGGYRAAPVTRCAGGLLPPRFPLPSGKPLAVCSLWHCPAGRPGSLLATTLPCGARTFLGDGVSPADATAQPTRPSWAQSRRCSGPEQPEAHPAATIVGEGRHVDDLPGLLLDGGVREQFEVPAVLAQRRDGLVHLLPDVHLVRRVEHLAHRDVLGSAPRWLG